MKMPLNWAKEFAKFECTAQEYADRMTMSGSKVELFECEADQIQNVVIGKINSITPHPDSDHMVVCQVDIGQEAPVQIVTGAGNLNEGDLVPAALHKSLLPGGKEIRRGKLRGVESNGMLCSLSELGLTTHDFPDAIEDGILVVEGDWAPGTPAVKALGMDDTCFEFEITPNRPDCLSVRGLARESAATFGVAFEDSIPQVANGHGDVNNFLKVDIENKDVCYRYVGAVIENVRVKPSPQWMRERLRLCGIRPINNLVDITNYILLEYGQPMHCFDYKYVNGGHITVRNAKQSETIETLDGVERALSPDMLVIADTKGPIAIAGVMGGEFSGVYEDTTTVVFESAMFHGPSVRTTSKKLGLRTEASGRYEKGLDPNGCRRCLDRALELVQLLDAGDVVNGVVDVCKYTREERRIALRPNVINRLLGTNLSRDEMVAILLPLGFIMDGEDVLIPSSRWDMELDCDIAEEIARFIGYNKMPSTIMKGIASARPTLRQTFREELLNALVGYGFYEVENFSFYSRKSFDAICLPADSVLRNAMVISNPLGEDTSIMRTTALPSVMEVIARNYNARTAECAVFEDATTYFPAEATDVLPQEVEHIVLAAYGESWDYLGVKGVVEQLLDTHRIVDLRFVKNTEGTTYHPGRCANMYLGDDLLGIIGEVHPAVTANYGVKPRVVAAEINTEVLFSHCGSTPIFKALPKHPAITRDLALVAGNEVAAADIATQITEAAGKTLETLTLFDVYTGEHMAKGQKSLAYNLVLRASDRTLTDEEAEATVSKILKKLESMQVTLRS